MKFKLSGLCICVGLFGISAIANANLLTNGDFDTDVQLSGRTWGVFDSIEGWTAGDDTAGIEIQKNTKVTAQTPDQYVELDSHDFDNPNNPTNSAMYQELTLDAGTYNLDWYYHARTNKNDDDNGIEFFVTDSSWNTPNPYLVVPEDESFFYYNSISKSYNENELDGWEEINWSFTLDETAVYRLWFGAFGKDNTLGGFVDSVSLAPVPEPTTMLLFGTGLIGLAGVARRKNK